MELTEITTKLVSSNVGSRLLVLPLSLLLALTIVLVVQLY